MADGAAESVSASVTAYTAVTYRASGEPAASPKDAEEEGARKRKCCLSQRGVWQTVYMWEGKRIWEENPHNLQ